jgi:hypothetical protein
MDNFSCCQAYVDETKLASHLINKHSDILDKVKKDIENNVRQYKTGQENDDNENLE